MEFESPPRWNWRLILLGFVFCGSLAVSVVLGAIYWQDMREYPNTRETDGTVIKMTSAGVARKYIWEDATVWHVTCRFRHESGQEMTCSDQVPTSTTLRRGDTVRVWYTDGWVGLVGGSHRPAAWGKWVFLAAAIVCVMSAVALAVSLRRRVPKSQLRGGGDVV